MRFTRRSSGGNLIAGAALTLLLCMLLFATLSWVLLKNLSERDAQKDAATHLTSVKLAYQDYTQSLTQRLTHTANDTDVASTAAQTSTPASIEHLQQLLVPVLTRERLAELDLLSTGRQPLIRLGDAVPGANTDPSVSSAFIDQALQGNAVSTLRLIALADTLTTSDDHWALSIAVPIWDRTNTQVGILLATQVVDDHLALDLARKTGINLGLVLCNGNQVLGTTTHGLPFGKLSSQNGLCTPNSSQIIQGSQQYLTLANIAPIQGQLANSPALVMVDLEPLYLVNGHFARTGLALAGLGIFIFALGIAAYVFIARTWYLLPLRRLQTQVNAFVAEQPEVTTLQPASDEITSLTRAFNLLIETLYVQETESQVLTGQLSDLLSMSDALISTLNLEHLLAEIVSRLGSTMHTKQVALLLYGRDMLSPWAVAHWSDQCAPGQEAPGSNGIQGQGVVEVYTDPDGDIAMAATTKMAAIPRSTPVPVSGNGHGNGRPRAIRVPKLKAPTNTYGLRRPHIPKAALRDLDMLLARMAMQKQKIAYGEDVAAIYEERHENWTRMALEAGYRSVIAVPLLLQEQTIGAVMLYSDKSYQMTQRDTFLLSTAAIQAAMAIQDALLFAEVKDKNAELERVNQLKSQFLATVTHELRTPLHSIISYGSLIVDGFVDGELTSEQEEHIQFMVNRAEDLSHLVDDMLDLSKIEADHLEIRLEPLSLESSLMQVVNQLKPMANNKGLYLTLEPNESLPLVLADSHRVRQIVINMVSNALKFTENGGVTIRCTLLEGYNMLRVAVHDTGIGISPAALEYIFEAFRQADGSTTRRFGGTGLGLTIARKLIELQGGEVSIESAPGQGSTFAFTLPIVPASRAVAHHNATSVLDN